MTGSWRVENYTPATLLTYIYLREAGTVCKSPRDMLWLFVLLSR